MDHSINRLQNEKFRIDRLAAQRQIYSDAKRMRLAQICMSYGLVAVGSIVATFVKFIIQSEGLGPTWIVGACGIAALLGGVVFKYAITNRMNTAAAIQEMFDCDVLMLPWNRHLVGKQVDAEVIARKAADFRRRGGNVSELENWYSGCFDNVPLPVARLLCQRQNVTWDLRLREWYVAVVVWGGVIILSLLLVLGLVRGISLRGFLVGVLLPSAPILVFMLQEVMENRGQIKAQQQEQGLITEAWDQVTAGNTELASLDDDARRIQDCILLRRKSAPLIFDKLYSARRDMQEYESVYSAEEMLRQYRRDKDEGR